MAKGDTPIGNDGVKYSGETWDKQALRTFPGMAHFAATGPFGSQCASCSFFRQKPTARAFTRQSYCFKVKELTGKWSAPVPGSAMACKYYERKPK